MNIEGHTSEVAALRDSLPARPDLAEAYSRKFAALKEFDNNVQAVLEFFFQPVEYRSAIAIMRAIPTGDLKFIFNTWLDELLSLGVMYQAQVDAIRKETTWANNP